MENRNKELLQLGLRWGLILALLSIAVQSIAYIVNKEWMASMWIGLTFLALSVTMMIIPVVQDRKAHGGLISFRDAFLIAVLVSLISSAVVDIYLYVLYNIIDPGLSDFIKEKVMESTSAMMERFGTPQEEIEKQMEKLQERDFSQTPLNILKQFGWGVLVSALIALIVAAILKRNPKTDEMA